LPWRPASCPQSNRVALERGPAEMPEVPIEDLDDEPFDA
jgi:hypothetical protein